MTTLRFGIFSTGAIATTFCESLLNNDYAPNNIQVVAVVSRDLERAKQFREQFSEQHQQSMKLYSQNDEFFADENVDIVYVASPHYFHYEHCKMALEAKKHVLCEKAFTINAKEAKELAELSKKNNVFLMEAMWTRFFPASRKIVQLIQDGEIGKVRSINVSLGFVGEKRQPNKDHRLFKIELGGGVLLDCGVYCISAISMIASSIGFKPLKVLSSMHIDPQTKTDDQCSGMIEFRNELKEEEPIFASFTSSFVSECTRTLEICGSDGMIVVNNSFHRPQSFSLIKTSPTQSSQLFEFVGKGQDFKNGTGFYYEIKHVLEMIQQGQTESTIMPLNETISIMEIMDQIRSQHNLVYPKEQV